MTSVWYHLHFSCHLNFSGCLHFWGIFHFRGDLLKSLFFVRSKPLIKNNAMETLMKYTGASKTIFLNAKVFAIIHQDDLLHNLSCAGLRIILVMLR